MKNIGIIGLGLIGGSIVKALKEKINVKIIAANRSEKSLIDAKADGVIDEYTLDDLSIFKDCDIIFICTPVDKIPEYVSKLIPHIKPDCIITDVGSTKSSIYKKMQQFSSICFIGGHPMAGSEQTGYKSAKAHLLENAFYILTPSPNVSQAQIDEMYNIVKLTGAMPIVLDPEIHDYTAAAISHVPHLIAALLVNTVKCLDDENKYMHTLAAGGFKDITRIASSSPEVWDSICQDNREMILKVLDVFKSSIDDIYSSLKDGKSLYSFFGEARDYRNTFTNKKATVLGSIYKINVDMKDRPGEIGTISTILSKNEINIKNISILNSREYSDGALEILFDGQSDKNKAIKILEEMNYTVFNKYN